MRHAVHALRFFVDLSLGIEVAMERGAGEAPVDDLERRRLDHAMACDRIEPGGLGVEDDAAHRGFGGLRRVVQPEASEPGRTSGP